MNQIEYSNSSEEHASSGIGKVRFNTFPEEWGSAPGTAMSEERAEWVLAHTRQHVLGDPHRQLLTANNRLLNIVRSVELATREHDPAE